MTDWQKRYEKWSEVMFKAFLNDDVGLGESIVADNYTWKAINAFGEHEVRSGRKWLREASAVRWGMHNARLLKNELLLANEERGIFNAVIKWTGGDGNEWASDFIYMISLDEDNRCVSYTEWNVVSSR